MLKEQVKQLKEHLEKLRKKDYELEAALLTGCEARLCKTKETDAKLNAEEHEFAQKQQEDAERIARYKKKAEEDSRAGCLKRRLHHSSSPAPRHLRESRYLRCWIV